MKSIHALAVALALAVGTACESAPAEADASPTLAEPTAPSIHAVVDESEENVFVSAERPEVRYYLIADT